MATRDDDEAMARTTTTRPASTAFVLHRRDRTACAAFSYGIDIAQWPHVGPWPPPGYTPPAPPFTVVFQGTNITFPGETYPATFGWGHSNLPGYQNPASGAFSGDYDRYAVVYDGLGRYYCETDHITVILASPND